MATKTRKQPNILLVVVDSLRADRVGCYGYERPTTPRIDRLAAEGARFTRAYTAAPFSPASYASMVSGLYPYQHGVNGDTVRVWPEAWPRLPERMRESGYRTFCISNNSFVGREMNAARGFDVFVQAHDPSWLGRQHSRVMRRVRKYFGEGLERRLTWNRMQCEVKGNSARSVAVAREQLLADGDEPFFGLIILMDPHAPYDKRRRTFCGNSPAVRRFFAERNDWKMFAELMAHRAGLPDEELAIIHDLYDGETQYADACVGALVDDLARRGTLDDTIVAVTADHGEAFGEHGVWGHGFDLTSTLTHVPLVVRCPRYFAAGTVPEQLVQLHDLHALCVSVADTGEPQPDLHSHCLTQAADPRWAGREYLFSEFPVQTGTMQMMRKLNPAFEPGLWGQTIRSVRSRKHCYVEYGNGEHALYDTDADSRELVSVHVAHPDVCEHLRRQLTAHHDDKNGAYQPAGPQDENVEQTVLERLRALGYME